jgi:hypothetical protein
MTGNPLALPHPRAIEVAVAARSALDRGLIRDCPPEVSARDGWDRRQERSGAHLMKAWMERSEAVKAFGGPEPFTLHLVLADTAEACAARIRPGLIEFEPRPARQADVVVVLTRPALQAILQGQIGLDEALRAGLVVIERKAGPRPVPPLRF